MPKIAFLMNSLGFCMFFDQKMRKNGVKMGLIAGKTLRRVQKVTFGVGGIKKGSFLGSGVKKGSFLVKKGSFLHFGVPR